MCAADYYVYYPENTPRVISGAMTYLGMSAGMIFVELMGCGLALGALRGGNQNWTTALDSGSGALMVEAFRPLGGFGGVCAVILALGPSMCFLLY